MKFGIYLPTALEFSDVRVLVELARDAEAAGWDGVFLWDALALTLGEGDVWPVADPWVALGAIAVSTERLRLGTMVTPIARRRPQKLARETATVDRLSGGRLILGVGLGAPVESEFGAFGEETDVMVRAAKLDEGLEVLSALWSGTVVRHEGTHFTVRGAVFTPTPVQEPRIPVWVGGWWPNKPPARRAARWDGMFPVHPDWPDAVLKPEDYAAMRAYIAERRDTMDGFDLAFTTTWAGDRPTASPEIVSEYEDAGATWWIASAEDVQTMKRRIAQGPPR